MKSTEAEAKICLRGLTREECQKLAGELGQPKFRGNQLFEWVQKGTGDFGAMTNLPKKFLDQLRDLARIEELEVLRRQESAQDGTQKFLFGLPDGNAVESVFMRYKYGNSLCVSSQAGCRMHCSFCASGINGLRRGLTAGEFLSEVFEAERLTGEKVSHVVLMGTGEPFDNYENVSRFIRILHDPKGRDMSMRNITVSTCGLVPMIERFAEDFPQVNLAVSLHAPNTELRSRLMPVNKSYPLDQLMPACREYTEKTHRRITFEYALIHDVNDSPAHMRELARLLRGMLCHVNLIPFNEVEETGFVTSGRPRALQAKEELEKMGIPCTVRRQLGADIDGACGQLRLSQMEEANI